MFPEIPDREGDFSPNPTQLGQVTAPVWFYYALLMLRTAEKVTI